MVIYDWLDGAAPKYFWLHFVFNVPSFGDLVILQAGGLCAHLAPWRGSGDLFRRRGSREADFGGEFI